MAKMAPIAFAGSLLDRADAYRTAPDRLAALMDSQARLLRLDGLEPVIHADGTLVWGTLSDMGSDAGDDAELIFLGLDPEDRAAFVAVPPVAVGSVAPPAPALWQAMASMAHADLAAYGAARSLVGWHTRHRFCPCCGGATLLARGGWQRNCRSAACGAEHFPRVDPVVIMTVEHEGDLLLGRQPRFPARRYSALAGFLEPGESLEEAVAREIFEEVGVRLRDIRYVTSQPWPFPSSLMLACHAVAAARDLTIDSTELEDARWFTRAEVSAAMADAADATFQPPPRHAVARHLLAAWLQADHT